MEIDLTMFSELETFYRDWAAGHYRLLVVAGPPGRQKTELALRVCSDAEPQHKWKQQRSELRVREMPMSSDQEMRDSRGQEQ